MPNYVDGYVLFVPKKSRRLFQDGTQGVETLARA